MAIDRSFRRIVYTLMSLVTISVITVGLYLYFNFNARSSLPMIVPENVQEFAHFQTRKMRDDGGIKEAPEYLDSLSNWIGSQPFFDHCEKPSQPGIGLYSDVVYFKTSKAQCMALSLTSEPRFIAFCDTLRSNDIIGGYIEKENYRYFKIPNTQLFVAFKYKAIVIAKSLIDSAAIESDEMESLLNEVFIPKKKSFIQQQSIQQLYEKDCQWVYFTKDLGTRGISMSNGVSTGYRVGQNGDILSDNTVQSHTVQWLGVKTADGDWFEQLLKRVFQFLKNEEYGC